MTKPKEKTYLKKGFVRWLLAGRREGVERPPGGERYLQTTFSLFLCVGIGSISRLDGPEKAWQCTVYRSSGCARGQGKTKTKKSNLYFDIKYE